MNMQPVNLIPPEILIRRRHAVFVRRAVMAACVLVALVAGLLGIQKIQLANLRAEQAQMMETMAANQEMTKRIESEKTKQAELKARAAILLNAMDSPRWGKILFELSTIVPSDIWIQSLAFSPQDRKSAGDAAPPSGIGTNAVPAEDVLHDFGEIRIQGGGAGAQSVSRFIEELSKSSHFDNVTPVVTETLGMGRPASYTLVGRLLF